jgi:hypothetical protein
MNTRETFPVPELLLHGQYICPQYENGSAGQSTAEPGGEAALHGTLQRFEKLKSSSFTPQAFAWIKATYPGAIEYSGQKQALEGGIMIGTFLFVPVGLAGMFGMVWLLTAAAHLWYSWVMFPPALAATFLFLCWITLFPLRHVWRTPRDLPIIFDRAHRKVYRMAQQIEPGLMGLIKPWPVKALSYEWDLIDAEHNSELVSSPNLARRLHRLVFVVRKSADDPTIIDSFEIGNGMAQGEEMIAPMYEHIRRFMEEQGPHLPHGDEPLDERNEDLPTWWQACGRAGPWGNNYWYWWKEHWPMAVLHHVFVGATLGMYVAVWFKADHFEWWHWLGGFGFAWVSLAMVWGQGSGIWLMAHTSYMLDWPRAVHEAIGKPLRKGVGW